MTTFKVFPDNGLIEGKSFKAVIFKIVTVRYGYEQLYNIYEYFPEIFAYIYNWFESISVLELVFHKEWFFTHNSAW